MTNHIFKDAKSFFSILFNFWVYTHLNFRAKRLSARSVLLERYWSTNKNCLCAWFLRVFLFLVSEICLRVYENLFNEVFLSLVSMRKCVRAFHDCWHSGPLLAVSRKAYGNFILLWWLSLLWSLLREKLVICNK